MKVKFFVLFIAVTLLAGANTSLKAQFIHTIDFEGLFDYEPVTNQYQHLGLTFSNATVLTAGFSLNEWDFPPNSGMNVVFDDMAPITVNFDTPVTAVGGYFTYVMPITMTAFNSLGEAVASVNSTYFENYVWSGNPSNELLQIAYSPGIASVQIMGDSWGGSYVMDDFMVGAAAVPEPSTFMLLGIGVIWLGILIRKKFSIII